MEHAPSHGAFTWGMCESAEGMIVWGMPMPAPKGRYPC